MNVCTCTALRGEHTRARPMLPPVAEPKLDAMGPLGGSTYDCSPQHTDINMYIARMRQHEYPQFMDFHMRQGMSHEEAHARWVSYEHMRVASMQGGVAPPPHVTAWHMIGGEAHVRA